MWGQFLRIVRELGIAVNLADEFDGYVKTSSRF
jgi:hypothetical protein